MSFELNYGDGATLQLDVPKQAVLADCTRVHGEPLSDPAAAVLRALREPLEFPPVTAATVPGDRIVIAVDCGMPAVGMIVSGAVQALLEGTAEPSDITILRAAPEEEPTEQEFLNALPADVRAEVHFETHDPHDRGGLCYLAASKEGKPIYLNRTMCDADVVLPIGTTRLEASLGYVGVNAGVCPTFADESTQQRFRAPGSTESSVQHRRRCDEADEAAWLLGASMIMQVVPGPGEQVLHVLAGEKQAVADRVRKLCETAWLHEAPGLASLVVASIEGGHEQQTWDNVARALYSASRVVVDDGAIVLCTGLQSGPGPALQRLSGFESETEVLRDIRRDRTADALPATLLLDLLARTRIYLLSDLEPTVVEDLGVGCVTDVQEINHLTRQHDSCIFLSNAQHAFFATAE